MWLAVAGCAGPVDGMAAHGADGGGAGGLAVASAGDGGTPPVGAGGLAMGGAGDGAPATSLDAEAVDPDAERPPPADACARPPLRELSPCAHTDDSIACAHEVTDFHVGGLTRRVFWQRPGGEAPAEGFPVVFLYQGSLFSPAVTWGELTPAVPYGGFHQGRLQAMLLEAGFMVVAPEAQGGLAWQTNAGNYEASSDHVIIPALIEAVVEDGVFGPVDATRVYATGISSGGYMTSRMAVSYPGVFAALAIQSGSYATCLGPICDIPESLPEDHPPTLLLHGELDTTVPIGTARDYHARMLAEDIETDFLIDAAAGHAWLADSPDAILAWFCAHGGR